MKTSSKSTNPLFKAANLILGRTGVFVTADNKTHIVDSSHPNFAAIEAAYRKGAWQTILDLIDISASISRSFAKSLSVAGRVRVTSHAVYFDNTPIHGVLVDRILEYMQEGVTDFSRLVKFLENLMLNPSFKAREELYPFLEHKGFPLTEDGCFIAYKGVTNDYWSITAGTIKLLKGKTDGRGRVFNGIGEEIACERGDVNDDRSVGCAKGLHVGSHKYANDFRVSGKLLLVKVNPKDVVSVPTDCEHHKVRACAYVVIGEDGKKQVESVAFKNTDNVPVQSHNVRDASGRFVKA